MNYLEKIKSYGVPERTAYALADYVEHGTQTGGFLRAVLCGDLFGAFYRADRENLAALENIVKAIYNAVPMGCWGDEDACTQWIKDGGLNR